VRPSIFKGKTDILIRAERRNVFVECKFWAGEKQFLETVDQLLSYLGWRDTKTAVIIFNRNANFSDVLRKTTEITPKHKCYKRSIGNSGESNFRDFHPEQLLAARPPALTTAPCGLS
jgi:hypothetical protein